MKIAVIKTGGKQYLVKEGDKIKVEKISGKKEGEEVKFDALFSAEDESAEIGTPLLKTPVLGKILAIGRSKKVTGYKYKPKTRRTTKYGHRQHFAEVEIIKV